MIGPLATSSGTVGLVFLFFPAGWNRRSRGSDDEISLWVGVSETRNRRERRSRLRYGMIAIQPWSRNSAPVPFRPTTEGIRWSARLDPALFRVRTVPSCREPHSLAIRSATWPVPRSRQTAGDAT